MYEDLAYGADELAHAMRVTYDELIDFVTTPEFKAAMRELSALQAHERPAFITSVFLDDDELARRGIQVPPGVLEPYPITSHRSRRP